MENKSNHQFMPSVHTNKMKPSTLFFVSLAIMLAMLFGVLHFHFVILFVSIFMTYCLIEGMNGLIGKLSGGSLSHKHAHLVSTLSIVLAVCVMFGLTGYIGYVNINLSGFEQMYQRLPEILAQYGIDSHLPQDFDIGAKLAEFFKSHTANVVSAGKAGLTAIVYIIVGIVAGIMLKTHVVHSTQKEYTGLLSQPMIERLSNFKTAFKNVFMAQIKISAVNTLVTALYLFSILPIAGVSLPFKTALTCLVFVAGLIPVVGNLISNTAVTIISLGHSLTAGVASLAFLMIVHKAEYFLNAKIIGNKINAKAFELLIVMLVFEHLFGIGGIVLAPVIYAYLKKELVDQKILG
mgnify:CR=1 FL=1